MADRDLPGYQSDHDISDPPPPYSERAADAEVDGVGEAEVPGPHEQQQPTEREGRTSRNEGGSGPSFSRSADRITTTTSSNPEPSQTAAAAATPTPSSSSSSSSILGRIRDAYVERRMAKEAQRKVDFYEDIYGFVPKNVMTQAEWRLARERAPKVKVKTSWGGRTYFGSR
ncbi:hypothetical protein ACRE_077070 [Hapsidospora chrysogenum ATCC 11550]|uniref:Uncharacterized protein n=1 Tax=Hapsidospora chrysogenum (strain ATCC 11550 / CBS 779.69 / DSM 880 / IAM 14645 / JCM 23072 / IMI 49137) TaxID=857340 RepID=A0A086SWT1_HAPC1|nr:hypothetical protein ACRE_077070 [Hapsidospora chrysogenum ATCC 11550]